MAPDLWIVSTLFAATFQTIRFTLQKILADGNLSPLGATYSRFIFAAPMISLFSLVFFNMCFLFLVGGGGGQGRGWDNARIC